mgnify:CR=1 FL=1
MNTDNRDLLGPSQKQEEEDLEQDPKQDERYPMAITIPNIQHPELIILQALHPQ